MGSTAPRHDTGSCTMVGKTGGEDSRIQNQGINWRSQIKILAKHEKEI